MLPRPEKDPGGDGDLAEAVVTTTFAEDAEYVRRLVVRHPGSTSQVLPRLEKQDRIPLGALSTSPIYSNRGRHRKQVLRIFRRKTERTGRGFGGHPRLDELWFSLYDELAEDLEERSADSGYA
jgi:hypothetical protein